MSERERVTGLGADLRCGGCGALIPTYLAETVGSGLAHYVGATQHSNKVRYPEYCGPLEELEGDEL